MLQTRTEGGALAEDPHIVAILVPNPALSTVLGMVLGAAPGMHIKPFESGAELAAHMHEVRIDLLVYDFDEAAADGVAAALKQRGTQIIGLTSSIDGHIRQRIGAAPFDEVIVKPMSPRFLLERVRSRLSAGSP